MTGMNFQVAVPKYITMEMLPPSGTTVPCNGGGNVSQVVKVTNTQMGTKKLMMKLKISYTCVGAKVEEVRKRTMGNANAVIPKFRESDGCPIVYPILTS